MVQRSSSRRIRIGNKWVGAGEPCFVVAEIGANFSDVESAKQMIRSAAESGADAVKIQTFQADTLALPGSFFTLSDGSRLPQHEYFKQHELSAEAHQALHALAQDLDLIFFSTPSHPSDVHVLEKLEVPAYKVGSDDLTNLPFLKFLAKKGKPLIISTGMATLGEVEQAVTTVRNAGLDDVILLHCVVAYPARMEEANLRAISTLQTAFGLPVGFSDHLLGHTADIVAVTLGAVMIEKHFVLDRSEDGPDNDVAAIPEEFAAMVRAVREAESALGDGIKRVQAGEVQWHAAARKSLVAVRDIPEGAVIGSEDIAIMRPAGGISPAARDLVIGRTSKIRISQGTTLHWSMF